MNDTQRQLLVDLRRALIHLHKTLLDWERAGYERRHGRTSPGELLSVIVTDPQFAWLHPVSELIVRMDEGLEIDALDGPEVDIDLLVTQARQLVSPAEADTPYAQRYHAVLQEHPDAVLALGAVTAVLKRAAQERHH